MSPVSRRSNAQTTNLDGESNLKVRSSPAATKVLTTPQQVGQFRGSVMCGPPDEKLYKFDSQLRIQGNPGVISLSADQLMLQATHLRNTAFVYGLAVYTGA